MSTAAKFFKQQAAGDITYRISQYRTISNSGPNQSAIGTMPASNDDQKPKQPDKIIAGETEAGGEEVAG